MTGSLAVHSIAGPDMTSAIGARQSVAALLDCRPAHAGWQRDSGIAVSRRLCLPAADPDRAAVAAARVGEAFPRQCFRRSAGCERAKRLFAMRSSRCAANGTEDGLPCRGTPWLIAVPHTYAGPGRRGFRWTARRIGIAGAPATSKS